MEVTIQVGSPDEAMVLFGLGDRNLRLLRDALDVDLTARGRVLRLSGEQISVERAAAMLNGMISLYRRGEPMDPDHLERELDKLPDGGAGGGDATVPGVTPARTSENGDDVHAPVNGDVIPSAGGKTDVSNYKEGSEFENRSTVSAGLIQACARSRGQEEYMRAIATNDVVFCIGPAGTGKTFLAVRMAVHALRQGEILKLILCRPAVEAGEKLGFLPGDFQAKINPYLRPLHDALNDILDFDQVKRYMEREIIEIIPLAYMRGRTLNNAFIILDEGQNTTVSQMKMFLTRMGMNSKIVVNGDVTQVDLPDGHPSGLTHARRVVHGIRGIEWVKMQKADIVRHPLVKRIVEAYEVDDGQGSRR